MRFDEINWEDFGKKTMPCVGYKSDHNTMEIANKRLIPMNDVIGKGYDNLALQVKCGKYNSIYRLFKLIGDYYIDAEIYIPPTIELEEFKTAIDKRKELFTTERFISDIERRCEEGLHIKATEVAVLVNLGEMNLAIKCTKVRTANAEKRAREEAEAEAREEERKKKYIEEMEKQYAEEKDKVITCIINNCIVKNVECDNGKNVIVSMCEECGIKIPIRTKGFMLDKTKFNAFRCESNGSITIWGKGTSKKVWDILGQLSNYYK